MGALAVADRQAGRAENDVRAVTTIASWGNSEAVRIPKQLLEAAGLKKGDRVLIEYDSGGYLALRRAQEVGEHRRVVPLNRVTFDDLFRDYDAGPLENADTWARADESPVGAELEVWSS